MDVRPIRYSHKRTPSPNFPDPSQCFITKPPLLLQDSELGSSPKYLYVLTVLSGLTCEIHLH